MMSSFQKEQLFYKTVLSFRLTFNITILSLVFGLIKSEENFSWKRYLKLINPLDGFWYHLKSRAKDQLYNCTKKTF